MKAQGLHCLVLNLFLLWSPSLSITLSLLRTNKRRALIRTLHRGTAAAGGPYCQCGWLTGSGAAAAVGPGLVGSLSGEGGRLREFQAAPCMLELQAAPEPSLAFPSSAGGWVGLRIPSGDPRLEQMLFKKRPALTLADESIWCLDPGQAESPWDVYYSGLGCLSSHYPRALFTFMKH